MKKNFYLIPIFFILIFLNSCSESRILYNQAKKSYEVEDYKEAVQYAFASLDKKPDFKKTIEFIPTIADKYINQKLNNISRLSDKKDFYFDDKDENKNSVEDYKLIIKEYNSITNLNKNLKKYNIKFEIIDYSNKINLAKNLLDEYNQMAAIYCYTKGLKLEKNAKNKDDYKNSSKWYKKTNNYVADFKDANERTEKNRLAGVKKISILSFENKSGKNDFNGLIVSLTEDVVSAIQNDKATQDFIEVFNRDQLNAIISEQKNQLSYNFDQSAALNSGKLAGIEEMLFGKVSEIFYNIGEVKDSYISVTARILVDYEKKINEKGQKVNDYNKPIYNQYKGSIKKYKRNYRSKVIVSYKFVEVTTGKEKNNGSVLGEYEKVDEWATYSGQSEIFNNNAEWNESGNWVKNNNIQYYNNLCSKSEPPDMDKEELVKIALEKLKGNLIEKILSYTR